MPYGWCIHLYLCKEDKVNHHHLRVVTEHAAVSVTRKIQAIEMEPCIYGLLHGRGWAGAIKPGDFSVHGDAPWEACDIRPS